MPILEGSAEGLWSPTSALDYALSAPRLGFSDFLCSGQGLDNLKVGLLGTVWGLCGFLSRK